MQETNLGLKKPALNEFYDLLLQNANLDLLDQLIADRIQKSMIVNNALSTNPNTVVAGPVAKDLQEQINSLNDNLVNFAAMYGGSFSVDTYTLIEAVTNIYNALPRDNTIYLVTFINGAVHAAIIQRYNSAHGCAIVFGYGTGAPKLYMLSGGIWTQYLFSITQ